MHTDEFWKLIPMEFFYIYDSWAAVRTADYQTGWEQTRMNIYYQYMSIPIKGRHSSYQRFKIEHIPFPWDKVNLSDIDDTYDDTKSKQLESNKLDPAGWAERIKNLKPDKKVSDKEILDIEKRLK